MPIDKQIIRCQQPQKHFTGQSRPESSVLLDRNVPFSSSPLELDKLFNSMETNELWPYIEKLLNENHRHSMVQALRKNDENNHCLSCLDNQKNKAEDESVKPDEKIEVKAQENDGQSTNKEKLNDCKRNDDTLPLPTNIISRENVSKV